VATGSAGSALARCVGDTHRFLTERWGQAAHLHQGTDVTGLLGVADVDHILSTMALRAPAFRVVKGGATLPPATYTRRARIGSRTVTDLIDVGRVYDHFAQGATIVLQGLHRYWPPVADLCRDLEAELTHPVQANAYITPPVAQGLRVHADPHDVFAIQTHGRKQWVLYEGDQRPDSDGANGTPTLDAQLWPGDCLYVPKGTHHAARTVDSPSIHLTLGVKTVTWRDVLANLVEHSVEEATLDEPLPPGFAADPTALHDEATARVAALANAIGEADVDAALARAGRRFWTSRMPPLTGQLQQLLAAGDIDDRTVVWRRSHALGEVEVADDVVALTLGDRTLRLPAAAAPALTDLLSRETFTVRDLAPYLDEKGRITLVRRLVREGLLVVADG
jgi:ribosomal protein L16 Arg81 hydroxylase